MLCSSSSRLHQNSAHKKVNSLHLQSTNHMSCCLTFTLWAGADAGTGLCGRPLRGTILGRDSSGKRRAQPHGQRIFKQTWHVHDSQNLVGRC